MLNSVGGVPGNEWLSSAVKQFATGGHVWYYLESPTLGMPVIESEPLGGAIMRLWTKPEYASEINDGFHGGLYEVCVVGYLKVNTDLQQDDSACVAIDMRLNHEAGSFVPIDEFLKTTGRLEDPD